MEKQSANKVFGLNHRETLQKGLRHFDIEASDELLDKFTDYYELLTKWNAVHNITRIDTPRAAIRRHYLDSLAPLLIPELRARFCGSEKVNCADIGTGAGFPGVPLALVCPNINLTLIEGRHKASAFLNKLKMKLSLSCAVLTGRSEDLCKNNRELMDVAVERAVGDLSYCISAGLPWLRPGGVLIIYAGRLPEITVKVTETAASFGGRSPLVHEVEIPYLHQHRHLVVIEKE